MNYIDQQITLIKEELLHDKEMSVESHCVHSKSKMSARLKCKGHNSAQNLNEEIRTF